MRARDLWDVMDFVEGKGKMLKLLLKCVMILFYTHNEFAKYQWGKPAVTSFMFEETFAKLFWKAEKWVFMGAAMLFNWLTNQKICNN